MAVSKQVLKAHTIALHTNQKFTCDQCDYYASWKNELRIHIKKCHSSIPTQKFSCESCEYQAVSKSTLKIHAIALHSDFKFTCPDCDFTTSWKNKYNAHIKKIHGSQHK